MKTEWDHVVAASDDQIVGLFAQFTRLRQAGQNRDVAWSSIEDALHRLPGPDYQQLLSMLRGWEAKEGRYFRSDGDDPFKTQYITPDVLAEVRQKMNASNNKKVIRRIKPVVPPVTVDPASNGRGECPTCHAHNSSDALYCSNCGHMLPVSQPRDTGETRPLSDAGQQDSSYFAEGMLLYIRVRDANESLRVRPGTNEMIIGRHSPDSVMLPDIDLSAYQADIKGVSRLHAGLRRHGNTLVLTDMGSLNHTHVNGQRLHAHEVRALHDGDEIRFGQLTINVYFRQE